MLDFAKHVFPGGTYGGGRKLYPLDALPSKRQYATTFTIFAGLGPLARSRFFLAVIH